MRSQPRQREVRSCARSNMAGGLGWKDPTPGWFDEVAVWLALRGRRHQVGRPLHHAERVEIARHVLAAGGDLEAICKATGCRHADARRLREEVITKPAKPRQNAIFAVLDLTFTRHA